MASRMSPCLSRPTAGDPPTRRTMDNTWRWFGLASSSLRSQASGQAEPPRRGQRLRHQLGLEREQRTASPARGGACPARRRWRRRDFPAAARGRFPRRSSTTGRGRCPRSSVSAPSKSRGPVHELDGLEIALAELHGARQRQLDGRQRRDLRGARVELAVRRPCRPPTASRPGTMRRSNNLALLHRRGADELGVVADDGEVVQRMHELHLAGNFERAGEDDAHVAHRHRHGVAVDDDQAARRVDHEAGAAIVALGDARDRIRHVEAHAHQRRRERRGARIVGLGEARAAADLGLGASPGPAAPRIATGPRRRRAGSDWPGTSGGPCARCARSSHWGRRPWNSAR